MTAYLGQQNQAEQSMVTIGGLMQKVSFTNFILEDVICRVSLFHAKVLRSTKVELFGDGGCNSRTQLFLYRFLLLNRSANLLSALRICRWVWCMPIALGDGAVPYLIPVLQYRGLFRRTREDCARSVGPTHLHLKSMQTRRAFFACTHCSKQTI